MLHQAVRKNSLKHRSAAARLQLLPVSYLQRKTVWSRKSYELSVSYSHFHRQYPQEHSGLPGIVSNCQGQVENNKRAFLKLTKITEHVSLASSFEIFDKEFPCLGPWRVMLLWTQGNGTGRRLLGNMGSSWSFGKNTATTYPQQDLTKCLFSLLLPPHLQPLHLTAPSLPTSASISQTNMPLSHPHPLNLLTVCHQWWHFPRPWEAELCLVSGESPWS